MAQSNTDRGLKDSELNGSKKIEYLAKYGQIKLINSYDEYSATLRERSL